MNSRVQDKRGQLTFHGALIENPEIGKKNLKKFRLQIWFQKYYVILDGT